MEKRTTDETDYIRLAERIWNRGRGRIRTKADFISVYNIYMKDSTISGNNEVREKVFSKIQSRHKSVSGSLFTTKKRVHAFAKGGAVPSRKEFDELGEQKGRTVQARRTVIKFRGVTRYIYRDAKGRFVKRIKE